MAIIEGSESSDYLAGKVGADTIYGHGGNDTLVDQEGGADTLFGGSGNDTLSIFRTRNMVAATVSLFGGEGDDELHYTAFDHAGAVLIDAGVGNDWVSLSASVAGSATVTLGSGQDRLELNQSHLTAGYGNFPVTVTDFEIGNSGDRLEWSNFLVHYLYNWDGTNPFNTGHMRLVQSGADTLLQSDRDGGANGASYVTIITFNNVQATGLTAFNLDGLANPAYVRPATRDVNSDFNGDGRSDVLWRNDTGDLVTWAGQAGGRFVSNSDANVTTDWHIAQTGDFNGDGHDDILWRHNSGTVTNWLGQADGTFLNNYQAALYQVGLEWNVAGTGDFNGDGFDDILWRRDNGTTLSWLGQQDGSFFNNYQKSLHEVAPDWHVVQTGDFNGDGREDVLWRNNNGTVTNWLGQADGTFLNNYQAALYQVGLEWNVAGTGDFNGDGFDDILWRRDNGTTLSWLGQQDGSFFNNYQKSLHEVAPDWHVVQTGDFNGDGRDDVLWRNDNGDVTNWLGRTDGTFFNNYVDAFYSMDKSWQVQPVGDYHF